VLEEKVQAVEEMLAGAEELAEAWLHAVGWEGQAVLEEKVRMAEETVADVSALVAHLPSGEVEAMAAYPPLGGD
jgi:hypothetical protein